MADQNTTSSGVTEQVASEFPPKPAEDVELLPDQHRQLEAADLLRDDAIGSYAIQGEHTPPGSITPPPEDVKLGNEGGELGGTTDLFGGREGGLMQRSASAGMMTAGDGLAPPHDIMPRAPSVGFDEVPAAGAGAPPGSALLGMFSAPTSMVDIQPLAPPTAVSDGPIPFGNSQPTGAANFFANFPPQTSQPTEPALSPFSSTNPVLAPAPQVSSATVGSPSSPSPASIISLEKATTAGEKYPSNITPPPQSGLIAPPPPASASVPLFAASFEQNPPASAPPKPLMTVHIPALLEPKYLDLPTRRWTDSTIFYDIPARDPIAEAIPKAFPAGSSSRPTRKLLRAEDVLADPDPFLTLAKANSWRAVAQIARQKLVTSHPAHADAIMRLWAIRLVALAKLKLHEIATSELDRVGPIDSPAMQFEKYPEIWPDREGSIVSFEIKLHWARLPALKGYVCSVCSVTSLHIVTQLVRLSTRNFHESINRLYSLVYECRAEMARKARASANGAVGQQSASLTLTRSRETQLQLQIVNILLEMKDFRLAIDVLLELIRARPEDADLLSGLGRVYLQLGNIPAAAETFAKVETILNQTSSISNTTPSGVACPAALSTPATAANFSRPDLVLANRAFLHMSESEWEQASAALTELLTIHPSPPTCVNNLAICQLYLGNVGQAISFLESIAVEMPAKAGVSEELVFNLCTLYDLTDQSAERKRKLFGGVVAKYAGDDFAVENIKL
ncbi:Trafficking protein particle complex subunit 12 [Borealophlyctis nickersoniae]|nr:Trafficking protein particle complex subunit 12 [Borealophlyctis nickersoniae]